MTYEKTLIACFILPLGYPSGWSEEKGEGQEKGDSIAYRKRFITVMLLVFLGGVTSCGRERPVDDESATLA